MINIWSITPFLRKVLFPNFNCIFIFKIKITYPTYPLCRIIRVVACVIIPVVACVIIPVVVSWIAEAIITPIIVAVTIPEAIIAQIIIVTHAV